MSALGNFTLGTTIYAKFTTVTTTGAPTQLAGTPVVSVYENDDNTQITSGVTLNVDEDGVTGLNQLVIVATAANGFQVGGFYDAVITTGTVGGTSVVGYTVANFTIEATNAVGVVAQGTLQSATASTAVLAAATSIANDQINASALAIVSGTGAPQIRSITDWVSASDTATVSPDWTTTPDNTSGYQLILVPPAITTGTLPSVNVTQVLANPLSVGGVAPASPIGI